jgi:catechol 2,3-dioxygenase-like lactoylglutathione lyase family enzyme
MERKAMNEQIDALLSTYESGGCSRRHFIAAVSAVLSMPSLPQLPTAPFVARGLNHVTVNVPDVNKSRDFYQQLLGLTVLQQDKDGCDLSISTSFLGIYASQEKAGLDHFCIGIDRFDLQATKQKLASMSIKASIEYGNQLYFRDPDGIRVQFSSSDYRG